MILRKLTPPQKKKNLFIRTRVLTAGLKLHNFSVVYFINLDLFPFLSLLFYSFYSNVFCYTTLADIQEGRGVLWPKCFENKDEERN